MMRAVMHDDPRQPPISDSALFLGVSEATLRVRELIAGAAATDAAVLVQGESGVGKELVAREIHARSSRSSGPFVPLNCAAIPDTLIESELFGHEAGAFTDARLRRLGAFEHADGGTLFLDEIGDLSPAAQPKLLRALETGEIQRLGDSQQRTVDIRVLAATHQNLRQMCKEGTFRKDLYYRLRVLAIKVPPLRERPDDIPFLAHHFAEMLSRRNRRPFEGIADDAMEYLQRHPWPGNARELRSAIERGLALGGDAELGLSAFDLDPLSVPSRTGDSMLVQEWKQAREQFERAYAQQLLARHRGNVQEAAKAAGLAQGGLYKMLRRLGLKPREPSDSDRD